MGLVVASTVDEAVDAMAGGAAVIAGGTDLVVGLRHGRRELPATIVAIDRLGELATIDITDHVVSLGAAVTHSTIEDHTGLARLVPALGDASALVGSPATRHVGTLGGNVMNASPAMDTGAPLVVLGAVVVLRSVRGTRRVGVAELWTGVGRTSAAPDELCTAIEIPTPGERSSSAYVRLEYRRAMEIAVAGAAASVRLGADGAVTDVRVALTAVAPTILELTGLPSGSVADVIAAARSAAADQARPISDVRASDRYRRHTVGVLAGRAVEVAARRAAGEAIPVPANRFLPIGAPS